MEITDILLVSVVLLTIQYLFSSHRRRKKFPPGPPQIPIFGSLPFLRGNGIEKFVGESVMQYGDLVGLKVMDYPTVMINDWYLAKTLFNKEEFCGRQSNYTTERARSTGGENLGLITTQGKRWSTQRSFALRHLKNFGLARKHLDACILPQAKEVVQHIENQGVDVEMKGSVFSLAVLNVIWSMVTGETLNRADRDMQELLDGFNFVFSAPIFLAASMAPWIRYIFPSLTGYNRRVNILQTAQNMLRGIVAEHKLNLDQEHPRDLIDAYLIEGEQTGDPEFSTEQLVMVVFDLMAAGAETTSTTLLWIVQYMVLYPEVQEECYREIQQSLGSTDASLSDTEKLPYCMATVAEVQRLSCVAVSTVHHRITKKVQVGDYELPEDTLVMSNLKHFMNSDKLWTNPAKFNPSRFISAEGEFLRPEYFVPLGHGKRVCMGESLAKAELAIFFVTLLQNLKFGETVGDRPDPGKYSAGFTRIPKPYRVKISRR